MIERCYFFLSFILLISSCQKDKELIVEVIPTYHNYSITDIFMHQDQLMYVGGDTWSIGVKAYIDKTQLVCSSADSILNCIVLDGYSFDDIEMYCGIDGLLQCRNDVCQLGRINSLDIVRSISGGSENTIVVGGAGFDQGFVCKFDKQLESKSCQEFPFVLESILKVAEDVYMCFGFGSAMITYDNGENWERQSVPSGHFIKSIIHDDLIYILDSDGVVYQRSDSDYSWKQLIKSEISRAKDFSIDRRGHVIIVSESGAVLIADDLGKTASRFVLDNVSLLSCYITEDSRVLMGGKNGYLSSFLISS